MRVSTTPWPWSTGPTALRPCGPSLPAAARERLRPHLQRATRGTQLPAPSWPKPFSTGRWARPLPTTTWGHGTQLPARVAALCRAARRGRREPRSPPRQPVGVGAWAAGRPRGPQAPALVGQGRGVAKEALARPWRPCARRPQRARAGGPHGERGSTVARPRTAPWRLAQRRRDQTKGPWGPGGRTESDRGHQKGCVASPSGNRTPVSRVTGGDTHHYTNEDGGDRPTARPLTGSRAACRRVPLPSTGPRPPRVPTQPRTQPTASLTAAARHPCYSTTTLTRQQSLRKVTAEEVAVPVVAGAKTGTRTMKPIAAAVVSWEE